MALCEQEQSGWASRLLESLDDSITPTGSVVVWLRNNLGSLNLRLNSEFALSGLCIEPAMSTNVSGIYSEMYFCHYFSKSANKLLGSAQWDWTEIRGDEQGSIRRVSKNEISKTYRLLAKDCQENLARLTEWFNGLNGSLPTQILYGERFGGSNFDLLPPPSNYYSECNFIWNK